MSRKKWILTAMINSQHILQSTIKKPHNQHTTKVFNRLQIHQKKNFNLFSPSLKTLVLRMKVGAENHHLRQARNR